MLPLLGLLIPALIPVVSDGLRGAFTWMTKGKGAEPANVDEVVKLMEADTNRLKALAELDHPEGTISPWVADLRASFRYIAAGLIIISGCGGFGWSILGDPTNKQLQDFIFLYFDNIVSPVFSFMFGARLNSMRKS
jgi:hypothetical protein